MFKSVFYNMPVLITNEQAITHLDNIMDAIVATGKGWTIHQAAMADGGTAISVYGALKSQSGNVMLITMTGQTAGAATQPNIANAIPLVLSDDNPPTLTTDGWHGFRMYFLADPNQDFDYGNRCNNPSFYPSSCLASVNEFSSGGNLTFGDRFRAREYQFGVGQDSIWTVARTPGTNTLHNFMLTGRIVNAPEASTNPLSKFASIGKSINFSTYTVALTYTANQMLWGSCFDQAGQRRSGSSDLCKAYCFNLLSDAKLHTTVHNTTRWGNMAVFCYNDYPADGIAAGSNVLGAIDADKVKAVPTGALSLYQTLDGGNMVHLRGGLCVGWSPTNPPIFTSGD